MTWNSLKHENRFEGGAPWFDSTAIKIPKDMTENDDYLDETEVQTRISKVIHAFKLWDLNTLDWDANLDDICDEYEQTALLTSIEHEFHTVFEDRVFESFKNLNEVKSFLATDHNSI